MYIKYILSVLFVKVNAYLKKKTKNSSSLKLYEYFSTLLMTLVNITEVLQATSLPPVTQVPVVAANGDSKWDMMGIDFILFF